MKFAKMSKAGLVKAAQQMYSSIAALESSNEQLRAAWEEEKKMVEILRRDLYLKSLVIDELQVVLARRAAARKKKRAP